LKTTKKVVKRSPLQLQATPVRQFSSAAPPSGAVPDNGWVDGPKGTKRPISPSIQIWKFSPVAYMHVGVRISGAILTGGMSLVGLYAAMGSCDGVPAMLDSIKVNAPILVPLLKMSVAAPLLYHGLGGARQLYQDFTAKGYDAEFQEKSSYAIAGATALGTVYAAMV
jgi:succinate dehydrogenase cytochrome b556 subunit